MPLADLRHQIARLPEQPGVYLYFNGAGETIYVGKARRLRDRVRSYLTAAGQSPKTQALVDDIHAIDVIVTDSVVEALALENNLIKQRSPRYNVMLRDDKSYPYLRLTMGEAAPRLHVVRRVERDDHVYAGPFLPAALARRTMDVTHRVFGIRSCREVIDGARGRPCLEYDIQRCIAPCVASICSLEAYRRASERAAAFLAGKTDALLDDLRGEMQVAADEERYEQAAHLRDAVETIETLRDRAQKMATPRLGDRDAFGLKVGADTTSIQVFQMRRGRVIDRIDLSADTTSAAASEADVMQAALQHFYVDQPAPPEVLVETLPADVDALEAWLSDAAGRRVRVVVPQRGEGRALLDLASRNAALSYNARVNQAGASHYDALEQLRDVLALPAVPMRIDCFDISTLHGQDTVASMVVCEQGRMRTGAYRKFRIAARAPDGGPDDFAAMAEVVSRRYTRVLSDDGPWPDLIIIDGGAGQLSAAYDALGHLGLAHLMAVGLAKKEELIVTRQQAEPIALPTDAPALLLLQRIRDEAHRFAVTFHRKARGMRDLRSELDGIPGIGPRRRKDLLTRFGSVAGVRRATREELAAAVGPRLASTLVAWFDRGGT